MSEYVCDREKRIRTTENEGGGECMWWRCVLTSEAMGGGEKDGGAGKQTKDRKKK